MGELVNVVHYCPQCGQRLFVVTNEYAEFRPCNHFAWSTNLGSIGNDEVHMYGIRLRLWKR